MNTVSIISKGKKLKVSVNGKPVSDVLGFNVSGVGGDSVVWLEIKADVSVKTEVEVVSIEPVDEPTPLPVTLLDHADEEGADDEV